MKNYKLKIPAFLCMASAILLIGCKASPPSRAEKKAVQESKDLLIGGKDWHNPVTADDRNLNAGAEHFEHHCQICHGLDGHATGVTFAQNMSPPVPDLGSPDIQKYSDGQLKWVIENGIRMTGMPRWKGLVQDKDMWQLVLYIRHLPAKGSLGISDIFAREGEEHAEDHKQNRHR